MMDTEIQNRRFWVGTVAMFLITVNYYIVMFKGLSLDWFIEYSKPVIYISGLLILGLSVTDGLFTWKK